MRAPAEILGTPMPRVEGRLKVTGSAAYPIDVAVPGQAYAVLVQSTIVRGRISVIATDMAQRAPGVITIVTHANTPTFPLGPITPLGPSPLPPLQSAEVLHYGQHVAMVIAETLEQAQAAASLITITYDQAEPTLSIDDPSITPEAHPWLPDQSRGDATKAFASADVRLDETYITADNTHNPIGLFAIVAEWRDDTLVVHDTTQWPHGVKETLAHAFGIESANVHVLTPFVGGAFGAGLRVWPHVILAALGARLAKRPVKLVLTRAQMFTSVGHRPMSVQHLRIGASRAGQLTAIEHEAKSPLSMTGEFYNPVAAGTAEAYACPNVTARDRQMRVHVSLPSWMRAPGHAEGSFALESAIDEMAYVLDIDPLELRLRNHAGVHPHSGRPWSSNALLECYKHGAERFGWDARTREPRSMRDGRLLIGYGMARAALSAYQAPCQALATLFRDGSASIRSGATDIGAGTYTVITQLAAQLLGLPAGRVQVGLGDSAMPKAPQQGGSGLTAALGNAVHAACLDVLRTIVDLAGRDERSRLHGCTVQTVKICNGGIQPLEEPADHESFAAILDRNGLEELTREGGSEPPNERPGEPRLSLHGGRFVPSVLSSTATTTHAGSFAAQFVEVRVDPDLGTIRVERVVSVVDGGRILNEKVARSQIIGGIVGGIGIALLEETVSIKGRPINTSLGDYVIPVNADVPDIDVSFVGAPDPMTEIGAKGIGELAITGVVAAIANAVFHATGRRIRALPLSLDKVMD
jgi:xanthine dehydrogenase YagR molybdenum-binding subunit